ncbi:MAG: hypothetical protein ACYTGH_04865 [Planctomycetota bacterium]|jgi:hypothetical protein
MHQFTWTNTSLTVPKLKEAFVATDPNMVEAVNAYMASSEELDLPWEVKLFSTLGDALLWATAP